jgi:hypothetical protein
MESGPSLPENFEDFAHFGQAAAFIKGDSDAAIGS